MATGITAIPQRCVGRLLALLDGERGRWFLWLPVGFGLGIGLYFALDTEPPPALGLAAALAAGALHLMLRLTPLGLIASTMILMTVLGYGAANLRTLLVAAPVIAKPTGAVQAEGWVERWEARAGRRGRLTLRVFAMERRAPAALPYRVRVTAHLDRPPAIGSAVAVRAVLSPPPEPVRPGGFDFARQAWFARLGGVGYALAPPVPLADRAAAPLDLRLKAVLARLRQAVAGRVETALPGTPGALAQALIIGERGGIPEAVRDALRHAGLAHILAISGLHMALMAGSLFWLARALLALSPRLTLRHPIRKWAALIAMAGAFAYLLLAGAPLPTQRAFVMIAILLAAVLLDRPALTLRNVALAALVILVPFPESLLDVSFQMSFAATAALVAFYEAHGQRLHGAAQSLPLRFMAGIALTTVVAGLAVAPVAAHHFHHSANYAVLGNLLVMPLVTLVIMPMALISLIGMPLGLEAWPLAAMGTGLTAMVAIARLVAALPGASSTIPAFPQAAFWLMVLGGLWLVLWQRRWRYWGLVLCAAGVALTPWSQRPDLLVEREGRTIALRLAKGELSAVTGRGGRYSLSRWLEAEGDGRPAEQAARGEGYRCDRLGCVAMVRGSLVGFARHPAALADDCGKSDILVTPVTLNRPCPHPRLIIDRLALWEQGAHAVTLEADGLKVETVAAWRGRRPWVIARRRRIPQ